MTRPNGRQAIIDHRRRLVAALVLRKRTQREVVNALYDQGYVNPDTGNPYALSTINADIKALRAGWKKDAAKDFDDAVADHIAELVEVRRSAWGTLEHNAILRALGQEADVRGLNAPTRVQNLDLNMADLTNDQLERIANGEDPILVLASTAGEGGLGTEAAAGPD